MEISFKFLYEVSVVYYTLIYVWNNRFLNFTRVYHNLIKFRFFSKRNFLLCAWWRWKLKWIWFLVEKSTVTNFNFFDVISFELLRCLLREWLHIFLLFFWKTWMDFGTHFCHWFDGDLRIFFVDLYNDGISMEYPVLRWIQKESCHQISCINSRNLRMLDKFWISQAIFPF